MSTMNGNDLFNGSDSESRLENELTSSISSELDMPGTVPTLTSSGRVSPHRVRPLRDQETQLQELKKENFGLKLRIYHLEDQLRKRHGDLNEDWEMNIQLNVRVDEMKQEMADRDLLLREAKNAIDSLEKRIKELEDELEEARRPPDELQYLQDALRRAEEEVEENRLKALEVEKIALAERQRAQQLEEENERLAKRLLEAASKPVVDQKSREVQTEEPVGQKIKALEEENEAQKREIERLRESCDIKDKKIQELELELLKVTNKMAAMATEHAQQMQALNDEINELKTYLQQRDDQLRAKDLEITELNRQLRDVQRQLREMTDMADQLRTRLANKEEECKEKDKEIEELRRRIKDLQTEVERLNSIIKGLEKDVRDRDEEIENLKRQLRQKETELSDLRDELSLLRGQLAEKDRALAMARTAAHSTNMDAQEKSVQMTKLLSEIERLEREYREETRLKNEALNSLAAKDEIIAQLRRTVEDLQRRLSEAEEKISRMTTIHATEKGVLQSSIEDLTRQLELKEDIIRSLRTELAQLKGDNEVLRREVERLRSENADLLSNAEDLEQQIREKDLLLDQAEHTIASLQKALEELSQNLGRHDGVPTAEVAKLQALLEAQEHVLKTKDAEIASFRQAIQTKDKIIADLQAELQKAYREKQTLEEALLELNSEKELLEIRIRELEETAAQTNDSYQQARRAVEALQEQVRRLEEQLKELSKSPHKVSVSVESTPKKGETGSPGSTSSTTMIIGGLSENLLLTILQRIEELYREVVGGRAEGSNASSSLSGKMDELAKLQKHVRSLLRKGQDGPLDLHEALLREVELLRAELEAYKKREEEGVDMAGNLSVTLDELQRENEQLIHEMELEKERSRLDGVQMEQKALLLEQELKEAKKKVFGLERQLLESASLQRELDRSKAECASLRNRLEAVEDHCRKLRTEITELRLAQLHHEDDMIASSLPDLHTGPPPPSNQWGATASSFTLTGEHPDLSELIERHREVTRLNRELQRKCEEKLLSSPSSSRRPTSGSESSFWQARMKQQEQLIRSQMEDKERRLNFRLQQLERQLRENEERREVLQNQLAAAMANSSSREQELISVRTSLEGSKDRVRKLEEKLTLVLAEKNQRIKELEEKIAGLLQNKALYTPAADGELKTLRKSNAVLRDEKSILMKQLANCQEQVAALTRELEVYQQLLDEPNTGFTSGKPPLGGGESSDKVRQLLEEIKALRRQLEQSIRKNASLSDQLTHKLTSGGTELSFDSDDGSPPHHVPRLPTGLTSSLRKQETSFNSNYTSEATPFVPYATSTVGGGSRTRSKTKTGMQGMGVSLEDKIIKLLNSSAEGIDKEFLQELLLYLQQQRRQLDDSQRLLDRLEQAKEGIPSVSHISVTTHGMGGGGGVEWEEAEDSRASSRASSVDLSLIHDQLRRTQQALLDSKKLLTKKHKSSKS